MIQTKMYDVQGVTEKCSDMKKIGEELNTSKFQS